MLQWLPNWERYGEGALRGRLKVGDAFALRVRDAVPEFRRSMGITPTEAENTLETL